MHELTPEQHLLLQKELFGELDGPEHAAERRELEALLRDVPQAASLLAGMHEAESLMASVPPERAPRDLSARVMSSLASAPSASHSFSSASVRCRARRTCPEIVAAMVARCPLYFFLVAGVYLLLGFGLQTMVSSPHAQELLPEWVLLQPRIAFATGLFFLVSGVLLLKQTPLAARAVYGGILVYIVFVACNGLALEASLGGGLTGTIRPSVVAFMGMGLTLGLGLGALLQHYFKEVHHD